MRVYEATFVKQDGTRRTMYYAKLQDLPKGFLPSKKSPGRRVVKKGDKELVWDIQQGSYRWLNHATLVPKRY